ncbi:MAG: hypothetical protein AAF409_01610 [Pseudomonadota bacterium]
MRLQLKPLIASAALAFTFAGTQAHAACLHNGVYYEHGVQLCFGGWLQECTVADYWSAIGMCNAEEPVQPQVRTSPEMERVYALLDTQPKAMHLPRSMKR